MLSGCDVLLLVAMVPSMSRPFVKSSVSGFLSIFVLEIRFSGDVEDDRIMYVNFFSDSRWLLVWRERGILISIDVRAGRESQFGGRQLLTS